MAWCNQIFSLISPRGDKNIVQNVVISDTYATADQLAKALYGTEGYAIDTTQFALSIGCMHIDGKFYKEDGITEIHKNPTQEEETISLRQENALLLSRAEITEAALMEVILS